MDMTILYKSLPFKGTIEVELKDIRFEVELNEDEVWIDINEVRRNDADSTLIELNDKLKTELLCLLD